MQACRGMMMSGVMIAGFAVIYNLFALFKKEYSMISGRILICYYFLACKPYIFLNTVASIYLVEDSVVFLFISKPKLVNVFPKVHQQFPIPAFQHNFFSCHSVHHKTTLFNMLYHLKIFLTTQPSSF